MRTNQRFALALGEGALLLTSLAFVLGVAAVSMFGSARPPAKPSIGQIAALVVVIVVPVASGTWWVFRKLRNGWQRADALAVALSFAVLSPLSLAVAMPVAVIPGSYAGYLGRPFGLIGAFLSVAITVWIVTLLPSAFVLWALRRSRPAD
jgi:hypothetical protein